MRWPLIIKKTPTRLLVQGRGRSTKRSPLRSRLIPAHKFIGVNQKFLKGIWAEAQAPNKSKTLIRVHKTKPHRKHGCRPHTGVHFYGTGGTCDFNGSHPNLHGVGLKRAPREIKFFLTTIEYLRSYKRANGSRRTDWPALNQASAETGRSESPKGRRATSLPGALGIQTQVDGSYKKISPGAAEVIRLPIRTPSGTRTS